MEEKRFLAECKKLVENLFEILEVELEELTDKEKELLSVYSFGMISVMAEENQISVSRQYYAIEKTWMEVFQYSKQKVKNIINSIQEDNNEIFRIMIYQGKFIYNEYKANNYKELYDRLTNLIDIIVNDEYKNY